MTEREIEQQNGTKLLSWAVIIESFFVYIKDENIRDHKPNQSIDSKQENNKSFKEIEFEVNLKS